MVKASLIFFFFFLFPFKGWSNLQFFFFLKFRAIFTRYEQFPFNPLFISFGPRFSNHFFCQYSSHYFFKKNFPFYLICCDNYTHVNISIKVELKNYGPSTRFLLNRLNLCFWDWDTIWLEKESSIMAYPTPEILNHNSSRKFNYGELP